jgi:hypothetical protein
MGDDTKDGLEEAKRVMARMLNTPPKPHKAEAKAEKKGGKPRGRPPKKAV